MTAKIIIILVIAAGAYAASTLDAAAWSGFLGAGV